MAVQIPTNLASCARRLPLNFGLFSWRAYWVASARSAAIVFNAVSNLGSPFIRSIFSNERYRDYGRRIVAGAAYGLQGYLLRINSGFVHQEQNFEQQLLAGGSPGRQGEP